jgi:hypothetical protein
VAANQVPDREGHSGREEGGCELAQASHQLRPSGQLRHRGTAHHGGHPRYYQRRRKHRVPQEEGA